jgi:hypothetical protein
LSQFCTVAFPAKRVMQLEMRARARASWGLAGRAGTGCRHPTSHRQAVARAVAFAEPRRRAGGCCQVRSEPGKARCRFHGGKSTGPKTQAGRARIAEAQRLRWLAYRQRVRAVRSGDETGSESNNLLARTRLVTSNCEGAAPPTALALTLTSKVGPSLLVPNDWPLRNPQYGYAYRRSPTSLVWRRDRQPTVERYALMNPAAYRP